LLPSLSSGMEPGLVLWPVMQRGWIKVCAGWPDDRVNFGVDTNLSQERRITEWTEQFTF